MSVMSVTMSVMSVTMGLMSVTMSFMSVTECYVKLTIPILYIFKHMEIKPVPSSKQHYHNHLE
jgi:hypothetical protein